MKRFTHIFLFTICSILSIKSADDFTITLKPKWYDLSSNGTQKVDFGGKWILVGSITFKKRSKDPVYIDKITLQWKGDPIDHLCGSLYKKNQAKDFLPIEDNLISDSLWNKNKQLLILKFDEKENLGPTTIFYLVLTIPESLEPLLKTGTFCLEEQCLPKPFKHCAQQEKLSLAVNDTSNRPQAIQILN